MSVYSKYVRDIETRHVSTESCKTTWLKPDGQLSTLGDERVMFEVIKDCPVHGSGLYNACWTYKPCNLLYKKQIISNGPLAPRDFGTLKNLKQENTSFCHSNWDKVNHIMYYDFVPVFQCPTMSWWVWHCGPTSPPDFNLSDPQWGLQGATCQFVVIKLPDGEFHVNFYYPALLCVEQWNTINDSSYVVSQHKHNNITFYEVPRTRGSASQEKHRIVGSRDIFQ